MIFCWRTTFEARYIITAKVVYTLLSDLINKKNIYTSLESIACNSEKNFWNASTHFLSPQASTSVWKNCRDKKNWIWLGTHVSTYARTVETNLAFQSASTEAFFLQLEICMCISLCAEKKSVTTPSASNQGYWRKFESRCFLDKLHSNFTIRIPSQLKFMTSVRTT